MFTKRTDLALEAHELWQEGAKDAARLPGVRRRIHRREGCPVTRLDILNEAGEAALGKPAGSYRTVDLSAFRRREEDFFARAVRSVGQELKELLPAEGTVLVAGLGNAAMTPDALGPLALEQLLITRHLIAAMPRQFSGFRPVAAVRCGVLGTTGVESAEAVRGMVEQVRPAAVVAIDALAARRSHRLCAAVQLTDTGIVPGSGVGNHRTALSRETLGVPVISVGVPTVVDAATLAADLLEEAGMAAVDHEALRRANGTMTVTPRDIDAQVRDMAKVIGYSLNWALQALDIEEITALLG